VKWVTLEGYLDLDVLRSLGKKVNKMNHFQALKRALVPGLLFGLGMALALAQAARVNRFETLPDGIY
jgi:uncharacterized membrane protein (DUF2068 family)